MLNSEAACAAVQRLFRDQNEAMAVTVKMLWRRLQERGLLIAGGEKDRVTAKRTVEGKRMGLHCLRVDCLSGAGDIGLGQPGQSDYHQIMWS